MASMATVSQALSSFLRHHAVPPRTLTRLRDLMRAAADIVFPPACLSCRRSTETPGALCAACWAQVRFIERPFCDRLGTPFAADYGSDGLLSPEAVSNPPVFVRARAVARPVPLLFIPKQKISEILSLSVTHETRDRR
jgi:Double zinc ribbon domain